MFQMRKQNRTSLFRLSQMGLDGNGDENEQKHMNRSSLGGANVWTGTAPNRFINKHLKLARRRVLLNKQSSLFWKQLDAPAAMFAVTDVCERVGRRWSLGLSCDNSQEKF